MQFDLLEQYLKVPLRNGLTKPKKVRGEGYKMVNMGELFSTPIIDNLEMDRVPLSEKEKVSLLEQGDLLFARQSLVREGAGQCSIFLGDAEEVCFESHIIRCRIDKTKANPLFLFYYFKSSIGKSHIDCFVEQGAGAAGIRGSDLLKVQVPKINVSEQNRIAEILFAMDKKLSINTQTNQTLEEMAQAIFKSWFVDFDPVKAKMRGEQPESMDADTASLFPAKLDCETGLPEGWTDGIISDIAKLNGKSWTKKKHPDEVHYVDLANTKNGVIESITPYEFAEAPSRARRVLNSGDTIVGTVRPGNRSFAYIGQTEQPLTGSTGFAVLTPNETFLSSFVYLSTTNDDAIDEYARLADGGAYPAIKPTVVAETACAIPSDDIAKKFWEITGAMLKKAHQNRLENEELAKLRDTLLPKLLSGEIELGKADALVEVN